MNSLLQRGGTPVQPPPPCAPAQRTSSRPTRLLLVDDDDGMRWITARFLTEAGYRVDVAEDGKTGWGALCSGAYDLLVTDHNMPRMTGIQLVGRLRFRGMTLPVIVASASDELGEAADYPWLKLTAILHKPFQFADLISAARQAVPPVTEAAEAVVRKLEPTVGTAAGAPDTGRVAASHRVSTSALQPCPTLPCIE